MKFQFHKYFLATMLLSTSATAAPKSLPENAKARGLLKKFDLDDNGKLSMDLYEGGPSISCNMKSVKGNGKANPKTCMDGDTVVTTVESDCGDNLPWGQQKKCHAASVVNGATGDTYYIDADGEVVERNQMDYPEEEDPPNENEPMEEYSVPFDRRQRSLLRGNGNSMGINFGDVEGRRKLQSTPVIDVLVVYSQYAKSANGGTVSAMQNRVNLAITESNQAYANSGIDLVLNLIYLHEDTSGFTLDSENPSSMGPSLSALKSSTDNQLDYVHQLRIDYGADMVALITAGAGCGIAYLCGASTTSMPLASCTFSVTRWDCATGYYSFSHELGHNMGVTHDKGTTNQCGSSDYRYGFRDPNSNYRSILAYDCATGQCDNMPNGGCTRQQFFSTPVQADWNYNGQRQGWASTDSPVGETNNAKKINAVAAHIAGFYDSGPVTPSPTEAPTKSPTKSPVTPTSPPTTAAPTTGSPTVSPTKFPTKSPVPPTSPPTNNPTLSPTTGKPTPSPTPKPTIDCTAINDKKQCEGATGCNWNNGRNKFCF